MARRMMSGAIGGEAQSALAVVQAGKLSIERAREAIAACREVDEAKDLRDRAAAVQVYLRTKGAALDAQNDAAEIFLLAERRMGQILAETVPHKGGRPAENGTSRVPLLSEFGVNKRESSRAQRLALIPDEQFAERVGRVREDIGRVTVAAVLGTRAKTVAPSLQSRRTPRWFFDALNGLFGPFVLDAYAEPHNALCGNFYTREQDGNAQLWEDATFGNPEFDDMAAPLEKAVKEADERGVRSCIVSPVGCAQRWYHESAIRGTIWVPDQRINFDLPDGTPTDRADRDTIVVTFGREHRNPSWKRGVFRVHRLEVKHLAPAKEGA